MTYEDCLPPLTPEHLASLRESISQQGIQSPVIVDQNGGVIDGFARLEICDELKIQCPRIVQQFESDEERIRVRLSLNVARRQLTSKQKRVVIESYLKGDPSIANNHLGEILGVSENTVKSVRKELEATSQIAKLTKFRGKDGKIRRKNRRILANTKKEAEKAKEVIDQVPEGNSILSVPSARKKARLVRSESESVFGDELLPETDDALQLLHCRLQDLKEEAGIETGSVQLILTDPPYERAWMEQWSDLGVFAADVLTEGGLLVAHCGIFFLPEVMTSLGRHLTYRWTLSTSWSGSGNTQFASGKSVLNKWLPILVFSKGKPNFPKGFSDTIQCDVQEKEHHKWQQPVEVFQRLAEDFSVPGDLVVDPCGGSFTTAIACVQAAGRRRFIGCDVDEKYVHIGHKRLKEELTRHASTHKKPLVGERAFDDDPKPVHFTCSPRPQRSRPADNRVMLTNGGS